MDGLKRLIREIHRRSLWQVLGIYVVGSWIVLQFVDTLGSALNLPDWFPSLALALLVVGLPMVLATAFVQEGGPAVGEDAEPSVPARENRAETSTRIFTWRNALLGGLGALAMLIGVGVGWMLFGEGTTAAVGAANARTSVEKSVAVLPFDNLSGNPDNEYFSDGITEELLHVLAQHAGLRVPGRTSSFAFKDRNLTIRQIADTLDVAHVLEGSVRRAGDRVLITAQLVDARTDSHLWSETYERQLTDVFDIQREIAAAIAGQLEVSLSGDAERSLIAGGTDIPEAHEAYLRGLYLWNQRTEESIQNAISEFERAIELDPRYADAYSGLADAHLLLDAYALSPEAVSYEDNIQRGLSAAREAVSLGSVRGMASLGLGLWNAGRWETAEREFRRAIDANPGYAPAHLWYALHLSTTGRPDEAIVQATRGLELDPVSQILSLILGQALFLSDRIDEAVAQQRETVQLAPNWPVGWLYLAFTLLESGDHDGAGHAFVSYARSGSGDVEAAAQWGDAMVGYRRTGEPQALPGVFGSQLVLAVMYAHAGQADQTIELLEEMIRAGAHGHAAQTHTFWNTGRFLADYPRYRALLEEAGITW